MKAPVSYIFKSVARFLFFLLNVLAVYLLLRGHNLPGGGFIGGLATAISLILLSLALGVEELERTLRVDPVRIAAAGLALSLLTGVAALVVGRPFLEHFTLHLHLPLLGEMHLGTPLAFDIGVFFVVVGITGRMIFALAKSIQGLRVLTPEEQAQYSSVMETPIEEHATNQMDEPAERKE